MAALLSEGPAGPSHGVWAIIRPGVPSSGGQFWGALSYISSRLSHMPGLWGHTLLSLDERAKPELCGASTMKEATKRGDWFFHSSLNNAKSFTISWTVPPNA